MRLIGAVSTVSILLISSAVCGQVLPQAYLDDSALSKAMEQIRSSIENLDKKAIEVRQAAEASAREAAKSIEKSGINKEVFTPPIMTSEELTLYISETKELLDCAGDKVIYGYDNRLNYYCADNNEKLAASATVAFFESSRLNSDRVSGLTSIKHIPSGLCSPSEVSSLANVEPERFHDEPASAYCSGFKIGDRLIATAGHCVVSNEQCRGTSVVFGYQKSSGSLNPTSVNSNDVYKCVRIVGGNYRPRTLDPDWRIIEVDRDIIGRPTVSIRSNKSIPLQQNTFVTMIGNPIGLPTKITRGGKIISISETFFVSDLDAFGGNSGAPVFNSLSLGNGELQADGILVSGATDFVQANTCRFSNVCGAATPGSLSCGGERATRTELLSEFLANQ
jgi:V8-like Glu-specific endopeptidase